MGISASVVNGIKFATVDSEHGRYLDGGRIDKRGWKAG